MSFVSLKNLHSAMIKAHLAPSLEKQVGRFSIPLRPGQDENSKLIMDRSNVDHCGSCGRDLLQKSTPEEEAEFDREHYYFPFTM